MTWANQITGANAGGPRQLSMRTRWAARVAQFHRYARANVAGESNTHNQSETTQ